MLCSSLPVERGREERGREGGREGGREREVGREEKHERGQVGRVLCMTGDAVSILLNVC